MHEVLSAVTSIQKTSADGSKQVQISPFFSHPSSYNILPGLSIPHVTSDGHVLIPGSLLFWGHSFCFTLMPEKTKTKKQTNLGLGVKGDNSPLSGRHPQVGMTRSKSFQASALWEAKGVWPVHLGIGLVKEILMRFLPSRVARNDPSETERVFHKYGCLSHVRGSWSSAHFFKNLKSA